MELHADTSVAIRVLWQSARLSWPVLLDTAPPWSAPHCHLCLLLHIAGHDRYASSNAQWVMDWGSFIVPPSEGCATVATVDAATDVATYTTSMAAAAAAITVVVAAFTVVVAATAIPRIATVTTVVTVTAAVSAAHAEWRAVRQAVHIRCPQRQPALNASHTIAAHTYTSRCDHAAPLASERSEPTA